MELAEEREREIGKKHVLELSCVKFFFWLLTLLLGFSLAGQEKPTWECPESNPIALLCNHCLLETKETVEVEAEEEEQEEVKPVKKEAKKEVEEEPEDKREHLNIIFIGHVGKNFASISVSGQLPFP